MPISPLKPRSNAPLWIATLTLLLFVFTVTAGAAPRATAVTPIPAGSGTGLSAVYVDESGTSVSRVDATVDFSWGLGSPAPSLKADGFSARWTGELEPRFSQTYTLTTLSDDGVRLWLDGKLVINNWTVHSAKQDTATVALVAGRRYAVKMEFFERTGAATARLSWASQSQAKQVVPKTQLYPAVTAPPPPANVAPSVSLTAPAAGASYAAPGTVSIGATASDSDGIVNRVEFFANGVLLGADSTAPYEYTWSGVAAGSYNLTARAIDDDGAGANSSGRGITVTSPPSAPDGTGTGLSAQYFDTPDLSGSALTRIDPQVDFTWGTGAPAASINPDDFSARWTGELEPRYSQTYTISTISDDGVRLWLDGQLVIDNWAEHSSTEDTVSMALQAGRRYALKLEYFELGGAASARLLWASQSQSKQPVAKTQLYPAAAPPAPPANKAPSVSLTGPSTGSKYAAPAIVPLTASASDTDGSVSRVEFLANGTLVGTDTTSPYAFSWSNVPAGSYSVVARAFDDDGAGANSSSVQVEVTSPPPPASGSGTGLSAQYFDNPDLTGTPLVSRLDAQVDFGWGVGSPAPALAEDDFSARWVGELEPRHSETYTLSTISDDGVRLWLDGRLLIDNWAEHPSTEDAVTVPLQANHRHVVKLEFFELGGAATARLMWSSASQPRQAVPTSQLYPTATAPAPQPPATNTPPSVSLTGPAAGSSYTAPATLSLAASASDPNGSVSRVEFLADGALKGSDTTAPYTYSWGNVPAGTYALTARAIDDAGAATTSQPVSVTVAGATVPPPPRGGGSASLFVAPGGSDGGSCVQAAPCASFQRAYQVAAPGKVVEVAAGTYPSQTLRGVAGKAAPNVVFQPASGARVVLGGLSFDDADFITVRKMEMAYKGTNPGAGNQQGVHAGPGSSYITLEDIDAGSVSSWFADHFTVRGGDYGPCDAIASSSPNVCGNNKQDVSTDVLIEGAYFHDLEYDASAPDAHWECMYINGGKNVTIRGNRYERCAIFDLFVTISGPDAARIGHENLTIENNWFGPATNGLGSPSRGWSSLAVSWCQNASSQPGYRNVLIQGNNFADGNAGIERDLNADAAGCTWSNVQVKNNRLMWQGCQNGWTYENNVFFGGIGCGATNTRGG